MHADSPHVARQPFGVLQHLTLFLIRVYQIALSPMFVGSCRFTPSCSHYAAESIRRFGFLRGSRLAVRRLMRCHPFGAHGFDPVPYFAPPELRRGKPVHALSELRRGKPAHAPSQLRRGRPY